MAKFFTGLELMDLTLNWVNFKLILGKGWSMEKNNS